MKKTILYVLAVFGAIFIFYLLRSMWGGFSSTVNPNAQIQKAKCVSECRTNKLNTDCEGYCVTNTTEQKDDTKTCLYGGKTYKSGDGFKSTDGCNSCSCEDGQVACTLMACEK